MSEESSIPGYFVGKGAADKADSIDEQKLRARSSALKNLAQSIRVSVQSHQSVDTRVGRSGQTESVSREVRDTTRITSDLSMNKVESADEWLDRASCTYWVRLRWSESAMRYELLKNYLAEAVDTALPAPERGKALDAADALLRQIDFRLVPESLGSAFYRAQIDKERHSVTAQRSQAIAVVITDKGLPANLARDLLAKLPGGHLFKPQALNCSRIDDCVSLAHRHGADHLLFARITHNEAAGKMGGRTGRLNIELTIAETRTGKTTWGPKRASEPMLTFGEFTEHDWREATVKAAEGETFRPIALCLAPTETKTCS